METKKIINILKELQENKYKKYYGNKEDIEKFISKYNLEKEDLVLLLNSLVLDDIFCWLDFISLKLDKIAEDSIVFINLLNIIVSNIKNDLAQGPFIRALINLGESHSELSLKIYRMMVDSRDRKLQPYAGLVLGGVGKKEPDKILSYIEKILNSEYSDHYTDNYIKAALVKTVRVIIEKKEEIQYKERIFKILKTVSDTELNESILLESVNLNFELYRFNKDFCFKNLLDFVNSRRTLIQYQIVENLLFWGLNKDYDKEFELIKICSKSNDSKILTKIAYYLAKNNEYDSSLTFNTIIDWIKRGVEYNVDGFFYLLNSMGKYNADKYLELIKNYIVYETDEIDLKKIGIISYYLTEKIEDKKSEKLNYIKKLISNKLKKDSNILERLDVGQAKIKVIGIGGAGNNMVDWLYKKGIKGAEIIACNTDRQHLSISEADRKILLGKDLTKGLGCGGFPDKGAEATYESIQEVKEAVEGADMVFVCAGMGGGTGTGGAPIVAQIAKECGAVVITVVTMPFKIERARIDKAEFGLDQLNRVSDTVIVIDNNRLVNIAGNVSIQRGFAFANELITTMIKGIVEIIAIPSLVNLDFADVKAIMKEGRIASVGIGTTDSNNKIEEAVKGALSNPLLDITYDKVTGALINIVGGPDMSLDEVSRIGELVTEALDDDANVIWGARVSDDMKGKIGVMIITTGVKSPWILGKFEKENYLKYMKEFDLYKYIKEKHH